MTKEMLSLILDEIDALNKLIYERKETIREEKRMIVKHEKSILDNEFCLLQLERSLSMFKSKIGYMG